MALQVGGYCYASLADAGAAACAAFVPSTTVSGSSVVTVSCSGSDAGGGLTFQSVASPVDGSASAVVASVSQPVAYQACTQADYVAAGEVVLGALLGVWAVIWGYRQIQSLLVWARSDAT